MTAEDKAKELIESFAETIPPVFFGEVMERNWQVAKECALICVEQAILYHPISTEPSECETEFHNFWQEVKSKLLQS